MVAGRVQSECSRPADGVRAASRCIARYAVARRCTDHLNLLDDQENERIKIVRQNKSMTNLQQRKRCVRSVCTSAEHVRVPVVCAIADATVSERRVASRVSI